MRAVSPWLIIAGAALGCGAGSTPEPAAPEPAAPEAAAPAAAAPKAPLVWVMPERVVAEEGEAAAEAGEASPASPGEASRVSAVAAAGLRRDPADVSAGPSARRPLRPSLFIELLGDKFKRCYERSLKSDPNMLGDVELVVRLAPDGRPLSVWGTAVSRSLEGLLPCLKAQVMSTQFPPPEPGQEVRRIPLKLVPAS